MKKTRAAFMLVTFVVMLLAAPLSVFAQSTTVAPAAMAPATTVAPAAMAPAAPAAAPATPAAPVPTSTLDVYPSKFDLAPNSVDKDGNVINQVDKTGAVVKDSSGNPIPVAATVTNDIIIRNLTAAASFGNNAWIIAAAALVFFMTVPGLALFYGGLVKKKNMLSIMMQSFAAMCLVSVVWVLFVFSLAFSDTELIPGFLGDFHYAFMNNIGPSVASIWTVSQPNAPINSLVFVMFQAFFAVITPALIIGAFAERLKFGHFVGFIIFWMIMVYAPIAHAVWSPHGYFAGKGALDFAGGTVVHINAGVAGLVAAIVLGKRAKTQPNPPHNLVFTVVGAAMLWFGWFGFNAGSGLAADGIAGSAFLVTNTATAVAAITWFVIDWFVHGKPTVLGAATGAVAGLVAITPASGFVNIYGSIAIGIAVSLFCYFFVAKVKAWFKYDDTLDCFGVHGIGGIVGALGTGLLADPNIWTAYGHGLVKGTAYVPGNGSFAGELYGGTGQFLVQLETVGFSIAVTGIGTLIIFLVIKLFKGKANDHEQAIGLDIVEHNERAYTVIE